MPDKYPNGTVSPSGEYIVRGGEWVPFSDGGDPFGAPQKGASISPTPAVARPMKLLPHLPPDTPQPSLPSPISMAEFLPGIGGALGAALGGGPASPSTAALGAGVGSAGGEGLRQLFRKVVGYTPATGNVQQALDLDPEGPAASLAGILTEMGLGALGERLFGIAVSKAAPSLRKSGRDTFAEIMQRSNLDDEVKEELSKNLIGIEEQLPVGTRNRLQTTATQQQRAAGNRVGETYVTDQPSNFRPAASELKEKADELVTTEAHVVETVNPKSGEILTENVSADIIDPPLHRARTQRAKGLDTSQDKAESFAEVTGDDRSPVTVKNLFERRLQRSKDINVANAKAFQKGRARPLGVKIEALKDERQALTNVLHGKEFGLGEAGKEADKIFNQWATVNTELRGQEPGVFPVRWMLSRMIGGGLGTTAGFIATKPAFWKSLSSKVRFKLANFIELGEDLQAEQLLRGVIRDYESTGDRSE